MADYEVTVPVAFTTQEEFINCVLARIFKRVIVRAGRRGGKTTGASIVAVKEFLKGNRILYAAPTDEQIGKFWFEITTALRIPIDNHVFKKNETLHIIEREGTENRIRAKTAWNADTLRGDYADLLILEEWQLMNEDAWEVVGAPMLLDNGGSALFIYTPPSLRASGISKARDPRHAAKMFKAAQEDATGRWKAFTFTSYANPHLNKAALVEITKDMSKIAYHQEILAEDDETQLSWLVYFAFNDAQKIDRFPIPKDWLRYVGHDFGGANPAALFFAQDPSTGYLYAYHEYLPGAGYSTAQHVEKFKEIAEGTNIIKRAGGSHQEDEIRQGYTAHGWPIQEPKLHRVNPQVDKVIGLMELNKVFVFNDMLNYLEELMNCMWEIDSEGRVTDKIANEAKYHLCACARYILSDFTPETVTSASYEDLEIQGKIY